MVLDASEFACMVSHAKGQKIVENSFALGWCNGQKEWLGLKLKLTSQVVFSAQNFGSKSVRSSKLLGCRDPRCKHDEQQVV